MQTPRFDALRLQQKVARHAHDSKQDDETYRKVLLHFLARKLAEENLCCDFDKLLVRNGHHSVNPCVDCFPGF